jgi:hypothetical protein
MDLHLLSILAIVFLGLVTMVGGYVYFFLKVMKNDPREIEFRNLHGHTHTLVPKHHSK